MCCRQVVVADIDFIGAHSPIVNKSLRTSQATVINSAEESAETVLLRPLVVPLIIGLVRYCLDKSISYGGLNLTTDQKVGGSNPSGRAIYIRLFIGKGRPLVAPDRRSTNAATPKNQPKIKIGDGAS